MSGISDLARAILLLLKLAKQIYNSFFSFCCDKVYLKLIRDLYLNSLLWEQLSLWEEGKLVTCLIPFYVIILLAGFHHLFCTLCLTQLSMKYGKNKQSLVSCSLWTFHFLTLYSNIKRLGLNFPKQRKILATSSQVTIWIERFSKLSMMLSK